MATFAYVRDLASGIPWIAEYPSRRSMDLEFSDLNQSYRVIYQHSFEPEDRDYPALADGEVLLFHNKFGLIIAQSIDLNYFDVELDSQVSV